MSNKTAGYSPHDHPLPYVDVVAATTAHAKGDLVQEGKVIGFAHGACEAAAALRLDTEIPYYATKKTLTDVLAVGDRLEFVAPTAPVTTGTVQALDQGTGFCTVAEAAGATDATVRVQPDRALYL